MATKTETILVDDTDGSIEDVHTYYLGLGETWYEIDLADENTGLVEELTHFLGTYAREVKVAKTGTKSAAAKRAKSSADLRAIRNWAVENGYPVSDRGRIAQNVLDAYQAFTKTGRPAA